MRKSLILLALAGLLASATAATPVFAQARTDVNIAMQLEPPSLDPTTGGAAAAIRSVTYGNIFEGLTKIDRDGAVQPLLAKSWDISDDGLTYTFHLQEGVKFQDGQALTADDVKYSLDTARGEASVNAQKQLFAKIASVDVVDPATVKVTLSGPQGEFLYNMGWGDAVIVAERNAASNGTNPVGTGPYKLGEWVKGDHLTLVANPDYWGAKPPITDANIKFISDPAAAVASILAGDVDLFGGFPAPEALEQIKADDRFQVVVGSSQGETVLAMNNGKAPLDNIKVREAIAHALDRKAIIDGAQFGYGTPIGSFFPPGDPAYIDLTSISNYDPEKSKALLAEAGVGDITLSLKLPPASYARAGGPVIQQELAAVGIKVDITNVEWADWLSNVFTNKDYDLTIISHVEPNDFGNFGKEGYYFNYTNPKFAELMTELGNTTDTAKQTEIKQEIQKLLANDFAAGFLFEFPNITVANKSLTGFWENSPLPASPVAELKWTE
jgi:peptide/nickel transport system substrate-binding protein